MRRTPWTAYLWPGLPQLSQGNWTALALAVGASLLLNGVVLGTCVWPDLIAPQLRMICWIGLGLAWSAAAGFSLWLERRPQARMADGEGDLFCTALDDYLKGNWFESERTLGRVLRRDNHDVEAHLMLATLLRHTRRFDEATRRLNLLVRLDGAHHWSLEIKREGELLTEARRRTITFVEPGQEKLGEY
jgi:hypothetical protein